MARFDRVALALGAAALMALGSVAAEAKGQCVLKAAEGSAGSEAGAKFQVDEALLQAVDWGAWASWMSNGSTPGYSFGPRKYKCSSSGGGWTCRGQAKICKL
jgi:hypothetical protein